MLSYNKDESAVFSRSFDPKKAESLLAKKGWKKNKKNGLLSRNKKYFVLRLLTNVENEIRREFAANIKGYYEALGIKVKLQFLPWSDVLSRLKSADFDAVIISWRENGPYDVMELFHSANIADGKNFLAYKNPRADQLMEWALNTDNKEIRNQTLVKLNRVIQADLPITVLYRQKLANIVSGKLHNTGQEADGFFSRAARWYLKGE